MNTIAFKLKNSRLLHSFTHRRLIAVLLLSFSSGLPLVLLGSTLQAWYTVSGMSLMTIGVLTLIGQPYIYKFLWAPLMDRWVPFRWGRRRSWILLTQVALFIGLSTMALLRPDTHPWALAWIAFILAVFSASQDIAIDAYRTDILQPAERGMGAAFNTLGYRMAMLVAGALALILAARIGWQWTYFLMAGLIAIEIMVTLWAPHPAESIYPPRTLTQAVAEPLREFLTRNHALVIMAFIATYKLCDALAMSLNTPFLIRGLGFSLMEVGSIYKTVSLTATLLGSLMGGMLMPRLGLYRSLLSFGVLQALSNLTYMGLALVGKNYGFMIMAVFTEYFFAGLSTVAFVAFLMGLCDRRYTATQFALFSSLSAVGRIVAGPQAAFLVEHLGWVWFYGMTFLTGLPALLLLRWLRRSHSFEEALPDSEEEKGTYDDNAEKPIAKKSV